MFHFCASDSVCSTFPQHWSARRALSLSSSWSAEKEREDKQVEAESVPCYTEPQVVVKITEEDSALSLLTAYSSIEIMPAIKLCISLL